MRYVYEKSFGVPENNETNIHGLDWPFFGIHSYILGGEAPR